MEDKTKKKIERKMKLKDVTLNHQQGQKSSLLQEIDKTDTDSDWNFALDERLPLQNEESTLSQSGKFEKKNRSMVKMKLDTSVKGVKTRTQMANELGIEDQDKIELRYEIAPLFRRMVAWLLDISCFICVFSALLAVNSIQHILRFFGHYINLTVDDLSKPIFLAKDISIILLRNAGVLAKLPFDLLSVNWQIFFMILIFIVVYLLFMVFPVVLWGRTLGKKLTGLEILHVDGGYLIASSAVQRELIGKIFFLWGVVWAIFDPKHRALHDRFYNSVVAIYDDRLFNPEKKATLSQCKVR